MPPKKGKKGGKKQDDDWGEDDKKVTFSFFLNLTVLILKTVLILG